MLSARLPVRDGIAVAACGCVRTDTSTRINEQCLKPFSFLSCVQSAQVNVFRMKFPKAREDESIDTIDIFALLAGFG